MSVDSKENANIMDHCLKFEPIILIYLAKLPLELIRDTVNGWATSQIKTALITLSNADCGEDAATIFSTLQKKKTTVCFSVLN